MKLVSSFKSNRWDIGLLTFWRRAFSESSLSAWSSSSLVVATPMVVVRTGALSTLSTRSSWERNTCTSRHFRNSCTSSALFMTRVLDHDNIGGPSLTTGLPHCTHYIHVHPCRRDVTTDFFTPRLHRYILINLSLIRSLNWLRYPLVKINCTIILKLTRLQLI